MKENPSKNEKSRNEGFLFIFNYILKGIHKGKFTVQHFVSLDCKSAVLSLKFLVPAHENLGTVQHFCASRLQKCCTVPNFLVPGHKNFRDSTALLLLWIAKLLYCPYLFGFSLKSAVLSLKNLKNYSPEPSGPPKPEGSGE